MGVEEIQKINNLAKELLKHHIASSSEEAFLKAEVMVKGEPQAENKEDEVNREIRVLGLKLNSVYSEMMGMQAEIKSLKEEMVSFRRRVESAQVAQAAQIQRQETQRQEMPRPQPGTSAQNAESVPRQETEQPKPTPNRLRTGEYTEKDVQVEKFFYFGTKK